MLDTTTEAIVANHGCSDRMRIKYRSARLFVLFVFALAFAMPYCNAQSDRTAVLARRIYKDKYTAQLVPLLTQVLRFSTVEGNTTARDDQQAWIEKQGAALGFKVRNTGLVTEVELSGPEGAPVLGLVVHGDVQPVNPEEWTFAPFSGVEKNGVVYGRGSADDKGPLVQGLLAMAALRDSGAARTYTIRLLVGSDEESTNHDIAEYLKTHKAPDLSLVLDSGFPVVVGEKAWTAFTVTAPDPYGNTTESPAGGFVITGLDAGLATSIVPSRAKAVLQWHGSDADFAHALQELTDTRVPAGYQLKIEHDGRRVVVNAGGRAAHAGVNIEGGRNALVFLANVLHGKVLPNEGADLLLFAEEAGQDIYGSGLGLTTNDSLWGHYAVNVATIKPEKDAPNQLTLTINIRALPELWGKPLQEFLNQRLARFNDAHHERFTAGGFFDDPPLVFDPNSKLVKRLMADYERTTGTHPPPAISGGGTYAKRIPNAIAFGMWFPGKPYPGHDVDEQITVADLNKGVDVLIEALADLATSTPINDPLKP
jgi:predicted dipeptidase